MENMLLEIKNILSEFEYVNIYDGYQVIAEIWKDYLTNDLELISVSEFYSLARTREPNIIIKGSGKNKREEQDGWVGSLIPNDLIIKGLYKDESLEIERLKQDVLEIEMELDELVEASKVEGSEENEVLFESLSKNKEGEPGNSFVSTTIKSELKKYNVKSNEYKLIKRVETLISNRLKYNSQIRDKESELIEKPLKEELDILKQLDNQYKYTLNDLDEEYNEVEDLFKSMMDELVVIE